jgi:hypothetical protein
MYFTGGKDRNYCPKLGGQNSLLGGQNGDLSILAPFLCVFRYFSPPKCPLRHKYSDFFRNDG